MKEFPKITSQTMSRSIFCKPRITRNKVKYLLAGQQGSGNANTNGGAGGSNKGLKRTASNRRRQQQLEDSIGRETRLGLRPN